MKTEAVRVSAHGGPEVLAAFEAEVGDPGPGEVRLRQKAIGVNYIDVYYRTGLYKVPLPHGLGNEAAGIVDAVGSGVTGVREGDRVAYGFGALGAYAAVRVVPAATLVKLPAAIDFDTAAALMLKGLTVQYLFRRVYRLQGDETILFHAAAGGVGLIACQWARALGVKLIGTVGSAAKARVARDCGAWATIDYSRENFVGRVLELTNGAKVPVVFDGVGKDTWEGSLDCLRPMGLMVSFGNASGPVTGVDLGILAQKGSLFVTRPTLGTFTSPRERLEESCAELFDLIERGAVEARVERRYRLADAAQAHRDLNARATVGSLILVP